MKRILQIAVISAFLMFSNAMINNAKAQFWASLSVNFQTFYDDLDPYGDWVYYPKYGYVWGPSQRQDFHPYRTNGHWTWTDEYGWFWVSDYDWGWAPFHYGRWFNDPYYGWLWVPDYEWSPAWVVWRGGNEYYGWAPMQPGISINLSFGNAMPYNYWSFVPAQYIIAPNIAAYYVDYGRNVTIINNTKIINKYKHSNNVFITGPSRGDAEKFTKGKIQATKIRAADKAGRTRINGNEVSIYKPSVSKQAKGNSKPQKFQEYKGEKTDNIVQRKDNNVKSTDNKVQRKDNTVQRKDVQQKQPVQRKESVQKSSPPVKQHEMKSTGSRGQPQQQPRQEQKPSQQRNNPPGKKGKG